jgi:hypothetical protein
MSWRMIEPIERRIRRYPLRKFRPETLRGFEREWRQNMPQEFSVDLTTDWQRHGVTITERRIGVAEFHDDGWDGDYVEAEVSIGDVTATLNHKTAKVEFTTRAIFSLHALTSRYRWGWDNTDAALIRDIVAGGAFDIAAMPAGDGVVTIPIGDDGAGWRARVVEAEINGSRTARVIAVRSWWPG